MVQWWWLLVVGLIMCVVGFSLGKEQGMEEWYWNSSKLNETKNDLKDVRNLLKSTQIERDELRLILGYKKEPSTDQSVD